MWISRMLARSYESEKAQSGYVSMSAGGELEVGSTVNARGIKAYSPYGYSAAVPVGEEVILIPSAEGQAILGTPESSSSLSQGEVEIASRGGARILLKNDGTVIINGHYVINKEGEATNV